MLDVPIGSRKVRVCCVGPNPSGRLTSKSGPQFSMSVVSCVHVIRTL